MSDDALPPGEGPGTDEESQAAVAVPPNKADEVIVVNFNVNHPQHLIEKYAGKVILWNLDGTDAFGAADTWDEAYDLAERLGLPLDGFVAGYMPEGPVI